MTYKIVRTEEYLSHHGIPGMKWGKKNGPPYPLKESDKSSAEKTAEKKQKLFDQTIKQGKDKANVSPAEKMSKASKDIVDNASNIYKTGKEIKNKQKEDEKRKAAEKEISEMSDQELREKINRMQLEKQYKDLKKDKDRVEAGEDYVEKLLKIGSSAASILVSGATIWSILHQLNK